MQSTRMYETAHYMPTSERIWQWPMLYFHVEFLFLLPPITENKCSLF